MTKIVKELANNLVGHISYIELTRRKSERLFSQGHFVERDINFVYAGLYFELVTSFERFVEDLFISILSGSHTHPSKGVKAKLSFKSQKLCRAVILGDRKYIDWLPYESYTLKRATIYFVDGLPFTKLSKDEKDTLARMSQIRNAMAHKSRHSIKVFNKNVIAGAPLRSNERTPLGYLRSIFTTFPVPQTRFEEIGIEVANIARKLTK